MGLGAPSLARVRRQKSPRAVLVWWTDCATTRGLCLRTCAAQLPTNKNRRSFGLRLCSCLLTPHWHLEQRKWEMDELTLAARPLFRLGLQHSISTYLAGGSDNVSCPRLEASLFRQ